MPKDKAPLKAPSAKSKAGAKAESAPAQTAKAKAAASSKHAAPAPEVAKAAETPVPSTAPKKLPTNLEELKATPTPEAPPAPAIAANLPIRTPNEIVKAFFDALKADRVDAAYDTLNAEFAMSDRAACPLPQALMPAMASGSSATAIATCATIITVHGRPRRNPDPPPLSSARVARNFPPVIFNAGITPMITAAMRASAIA